MTSFKIGDVIICTCGGELCKPFQIDYISDYVISGVGADSEIHTYHEIDFSKLRKLTKLELALK